MVTLIKLIFEQIYLLWTPCSDHIFLYIHVFWYWKPEVNVYLKNCCFINLSNFFPGLKLIQAHSFFNLKEGFFLPILLSTLSSIYCHISGNTARAIYFSATNLVFFFIIWSIFRMHYLHSILFFFYTYAFRLTFMVHLLLVSCFVLCLVFFKFFYPFNLVYYIDYHAFLNLKLEKWVDEIRALFFLLYRSFKKIK